MSSTLAKRKTLTRRVALWGKCAANGVLRVRSPFLPKKRYAMMGSDSRPQSMKGFLNIIELHTSLLVNGADSPL